MFCSTILCRGKSVWDIDKRWLDMKMKDQKALSSEAGSRLTFVGHLCGHAN